MEGDARYLREMIERAADAVQSLDERCERWFGRFDRILRGGNGKPGLEEEARAAAKKIKALEARVAVLENDRASQVPPVERERTKQAYLQTAKEWAALAGASLAVILAVVNLFILLGGS